MFLCFLLLSISAAHEMETSATSANCWQSTIQKSSSPGQTPVFYHTTLSPSLLLPAAILWCLRCRISSAWDWRVRLDRDLVFFCVCKALSLSLEFSPSLLCHLFNNTELYYLSDIKTYFKNAFILLWVLKLQQQQGNVFYKWHKRWLEISCVNWQYLPSVGSAICVVSHWLVAYPW